MNSRDKNPSKYSPAASEEAELKGEETLNKVKTSDPEVVNNIDSVIGERSTGTSPNDIAGVSDLDAGLGRARGSRRSH